MSTRTPPGTFHKITARNFSWRVARNKYIQAIYRKAFVWKSPPSQVRNNSSRLKTKLKSQLGSQNVFGTDNATVTISELLDSRAPSGEEPRSTAISLGAEGGQEAWKTWGQIQKRVEAQNVGRRKTGAILTPNATPTLQLLIRFSPKHSIRKWGRAPPLITWRHDQWRARILLASTHLVSIRVGISERTVDGVVALLVMEA